MKQILNPTLVVIILGFATFKAYAETIPVTETECNLVETSTVPINSGPRKGEFIINGRVELSDQDKVLFSNNYSDSLYNSLTSTNSLAYCEKLSLLANQAGQLTLKTKERTFAQQVGNQKNTLKTIAYSDKLACEAKDLPRQNGGLVYLLEGTEILFVTDYSLAYNELRQKNFVQSNCNSFIEQVKEKDRLSINWLYPLFF